MVTEVKEMSENVVKHGVALEVAAKNAYKFADEVLTHAWMKDAMSNDRKLGNSLAYLRSFNARQVKAVAMKVLANSLTAAGFPGLPPPKKQKARPSRGGGGDAGAAWGAGAWRNLFGGMWT